MTQNKVPWLNAALALTDLSLFYTVHCKAAFPQQCLYFLPEPQGKDRSVRFFALRTDIPFLLPPSLGS